MRNLTLGDLKKIDLPDDTSIVLPGMVLNYARRAIVASYEFPTDPGMYQVEDLSETVRTIVVPRPRSVRVILIDGLSSTAYPENHSG